MMSGYNPSYGQFCCGDMGGWNVGQYAMNMEMGNPCCPPPQKHHHCPPREHHEERPVLYTVRKGDSVYKIAQKFGTSMQAIIRANHLQNPDLIFPGQVFVIPRV